MAYDKDLNTVLEKANNEELQPLVDYITKKFSNYIVSDERYKDYPNEPTRYYELIANEIRAMGGNTFANLLRGGEGVSYHEVVCDVAQKLKVNFNKNSSVERIEEEILQKIFEEAWNKMSISERNAIVNELGNMHFPGEVAVMGAQAVIKLGGFKSYQIAVIIANAIARKLLGHGLSLAANAGLTKAISIFAGPIGWAISGVWTLIDIAGPSYKTTIPCVIQVALIRRSHRDDPYKLYE